MMHSLPYQILVAGCALLMACSIAPETPDARYQAGLQSKKEGDVQEAFSKFENAVKRDPGHRKAQLELVSLHMNRNEPDHAVSHLTNLIDHIREREGRTPPADLFARRGRIFYQAGNYRKAIRDTSRALERNPELTEAYNSRGLAYLARDRVEKARRNFRNSLDVNENAGAYFGLAKLRMRRGDWETAIEHLNRAVKLEPELVQAYKYRAVAYRETGRTERMKKDLNTFLRLANPEVSEQEIRERIERMVKKYREQPEG